MSSETQGQNPVVVECPGVDSAVLMRTAAISASVSASVVIAIFLIILGCIRRRRAPQAATITAPPAPPPPAAWPAPPPYSYSATDFYAQAPPTYAPPTPFYAPPSWPHVTVVNHNRDGGDRDLEMAAATLGYATAAGTSAAAACAIMSPTLHGLRDGSN